MRREDRVGLAQRIGAVAGPRVVGRVRYPIGACRIKLDVALAQPQIGRGLDRRGLVAAVPQGSGAPVDSIDVLSGVPPP
jgi:hypothetical protein